MKTVRNISFAILAMTMLAPSTLFAQEKGVTIGGGADIVSAYVWRGNYQTSSSFQPTLYLGAGNFTLTAWGSVDFAGTDLKEMDLTAAYALGPVTLSVTDYYWTGSSLQHTRPARNYFHFGADSPHIIEAGVKWQISESFPLTLSWNTMFFGADKKDNGKQNYSTYAEVSYPFSVKGIDMNSGVGMTPWATKNMYGTTGTAVTNVFVGGAKTWALMEKSENPLSLGIFTTLIWNPFAEDVNFTGGISFRF